jgi:ketosteroid isomerase-like protein
MENKQLIQNGFDSWANKTGNFFDLLADDVQWTITGSAPLQVDFLASFAAFTGQPLKTGDARDSFDEMDVLLGKSKQGREYLVEQGDGGLAIVKGKWKYIPPAGGPAIYTSVNIEVGERLRPTIV